MISVRGQGKEGNREPACCQIMVTISILMMNNKLMTMPVVTVPLATCYLLFATTAKNFHFAQPPHSQSYTANELKEGTDTS